MPITSFLTFSFFATVDLVPKHESWFAWECVTSAMDTLLAHVRHHHRLVALGRPRTGDGVGLAHLGNTALALYLQNIQSQLFGGRWTMKIKRRRIKKMSTILQMERYPLNLKTTGSSTAIYRAYKTWSRLARSKRQWLAESSLNFDNTLWCFHWFVWERMTTMSDSTTVSKIKGEREEFAPSSKKLAPAWVKNTDYLCRRCTSLLLLVTDQCRQFGPAHGHKKRSRYICSTEHLSFVRGREVMIETTERDTKHVLC